MFKFIGKAVGAGLGSYGYASWTSHGIVAIRLAWH